MIGTESDNANLRDEVNAKIREGHDKLQFLNKEIQDFGNMDVPFDKQVSELPQTESQDNAIDANSIQLELRVQNVRDDKFDAYQRIVTELAQQFQEQCQSIKDKMKAFIDLAEKRRES